MSSSEAARLLLYDLGRPLPEPPESPFREGVEPEHLGRPWTPPPTPDDAYRRGFADGEREGRAAAQKELAPALEELRLTARSMADVREQRLLAAEGELIGVAAEIARHILRGELALGGDVVLRMARACLERAQDEGDLVLRLHPDSLEPVRAHAAELEAELAERRLRLAADPSVPPGACVLETATRCYDGRPERLLDEALAGAHHAAESKP